MELTLLGTVAVLAFVVVGAAIMLLVSFRRTIELRGALIQAMRRIERLEATIVSGAPLDITVTHAPAEAIAAPKERPRLLDAPPTIDEIAASIDARDRIDPPHLGVLSFGAGLAAFAALAAARVEALSGGAGLFIAVLVGFVVIGAAEWRLRADRKGDVSTDERQALLAALLGIVIMFAALMYARWLLGTLHAHAAVFAMSALACIAAFASLRFGAPLLGVGLVCAAVAPGLSPIGATGAWGQYAFLFGFTALAMTLSRRAQAPIWAWLAAAIAVFWGVNAAVIGGAPFNIAVVGFYSSALAGLGLLFAWQDAADLPCPRFWGAPWSGAMLLGHGLTVVAAATLAALLLRHPAPIALAGGALALFALVSTAATALRPGLWLAPMLALTTCAVTIAFWPATAAVVDAPMLTLLCAALALLFALGGWASMLRAQDPRPSAAVAAIGPVLIFAAAFWRIGDFGGPQAWATAALAIAGLNTLAYVQLRGANAAGASAFAAGAALAGAAALATIAPPPYQPLALAAALPLVALMERFRNEAGLRFAAGVICVLLFASLIMPQLFLATASPPWLLGVLFVPCAAGAWIASLLFARGPPARDVAAAQTAFALALLVAGAGATLAARHAFTGGATNAPYASLVEAGLNTLIWLVFAGVLAWRFGPRARGPIFFLEFAAFAAAATHALVIPGVLINPWWGYAPAVAGGWAMLAFAFALPGGLFVAYSELRRRQGLPARASAALFVGVILLFISLLLELRRLFHGAAMAEAPLLSTEAWAYSVAMLGFAALMFAAAAQLNSKVVRYAALALALAALAKMAFSDLGALDGVGRIGAFLVIAAAAGALVFFFRRFVLPAAARQPKTLADPNPAPPS